MILLNNIDNVCKKLDPGKDLALLSLNILNEDRAQSHNFNIEFLIQVCIFDYH